MDFKLKSGAQVIFSGEAVDGKVSYLDFNFEEKDWRLQTIQYQDGPALPTDYKWEIGNALSDQNWEKLKTIMTDINYLESLEKVEILEENRRETINMPTIPYGAIVRMPWYLDEKKGLFLRYAYGIESHPFEHEFVKMSDNGKRQFRKIIKN